MTEWVGDWVGKLLAGAGALLIWLAGRQGYRWLVTSRKDLADAAHITSNTSITTLQMSDFMVREWMRSASDASKLLMEAQRKIILSEHCFRECIRLLRAGGINNDEVDALEARFNKITNDALSGE